MLKIGPAATETQIAESPESRQKFFMEKLLNPPAETNVMQLRKIADDLNAAMELNTYPYSPMPRDVLSVAMLGEESYVVYRGTIIRHDGPDDGPYLVERLERVRELLKLNIDGPISDLSSPILVLESLEKKVAQAYQ